MVKLAFSEIEHGIPSFIASSICENRSGGKSVGTPGMLAKSAWSACAPLLWERAACSRTPAYVRYTSLPRFQYANKSCAVSLADVEY